MKSRPFNAFVGSSSGIFKGVSAVEKSEVLVVNIDGLKGATNRNPVTSLSWAESDEGREVLVGFANQTVKTYNVGQSKFVRTEEKKCGEGAIIGLTKHQGALVTAVESGIIKVWKDGDSGKTINCGGPLERMVTTAASTLATGTVTTLATGGKENDLKLWDLNTSKLVFHAKNVRHDELELRVPVWVTDISFLDTKVAVTTKHGHVRLYDPLSSQRRPVVNVLVPGQALTSISTCIKEKHVIVGSGTGQMNLVDLRSKGLVMNKYKGFVGSVKSISASLEHPYIASVSTDRHFRVHHLETKELLVKEYLQSKLTRVLVPPDFDFRQSDPVDELDEEGIQVEDRTPEEDLKKEQVELPPPPPAVEKRSRSSGPAHKKKHKSS